MHNQAVDDDVQLAKLVSSALIEAGHDTIFVHNGERALDKAKETPFDLVVLVQRRCRCREPSKYRPNAAAIVCIVHKDFTTL